LHCSPTGLAAASTEVRADKLATRPAFATDTHCCSMASSKDWEHKFNSKHDKMSLESLPLLSISLRSFYQVKNKNNT
jgi:hypothetical protein